MRLFMPFPPAEQREPDRKGKRRTLAELGIDPDFAPCGAHR
jgi:hypothetical protein